MNVTFTKMRVEEKTKMGMMISGECIKLCVLINCCVLN